MLRRPRPRIRALRWLPLLCAAACSVDDELSKGYLQPTSRWLVEPGQLGYGAEAFELPVGSGSLTGWLVRAPDARGRTVLLFHGRADNASMMHPYWSFLVDAGLNVCVFDYRGYGRSQGTPTLRAMCYDMPELLDWLREQPGVDGDRLGFYGLSLGSVVALYTAVRQDGCRAIVVEDVPSLRDMIEEKHREKSGIPAGFSAGYVEFTSVPDGAEASESAAALRVPSLWIAGAAAPRAELRATLRAYVEMGGDKQLWTLPETGLPPHSLLTHDGEYQRAVARFFASALDGAAERVAVDWRRRGGSGTWEIALGRREAGAGTEPWAVQICALDKDAEPTFQYVWLAGAQQSVPVELPAEPGVVGAMRLVDVERTESGSFRRATTALSRAGRWYEENKDRFASLRAGKPDLQQAKDAAALIRARDDVERLPPVLEAELADVFSIVGRQLAASPDAEDRARGLAWLQRAVGAEPARPERHFWPGQTPTFGFPHGEAVAAARARLQELTGR